MRPELKKIKSRKNEQELPGSRFNISFYLLATGIQADAIVSQVDPASTPKLHVYTESVLVDWTKEKILHLSFLVTLIACCLFSSRLLSPHNNNRHSFRTQMAPLYVTYKYHVFYRNDFRWRPSGAVGNNTVWPSTLMGDTVTCGPRSAMQ